MLHLLEADPGDLAGPPTREGHRSLLWGERAAFSAQPLPRAPVVRLPLLRCVGVPRGHLWFALLEVFPS